MLPPLRRWILGTIFSVSLFLLLWNTLLNLVPHGQRIPPQAIDRIIHPGLLKPKFRWRDVPQQHPLHEFTPLPSGPKVSIPQVQHDFAPETLQQAAERKRRLSAVEAAFRHSWEGYSRNAWLQDEVSPLTGESRNPFGGWGATLVDTLDTLWIMGMKKEFKSAVSGLKKIEFTTATLREVNVFETTIRYLGGLLSAYDVSGHKHDILLQRAVELGEMIYHAFDTPNRLPVTRWDWQKTALGKDQEAKSQSLVAEVGSLTLEFTRLSQLTGDPKWYDAVARITNLFEEQQNHTKLPGLWPTFVNARNADFKKDTTFTMGGMADSLYEYLPKQHLMLGGQNTQYRDMYFTALPKAKKHLFFRPLTPDNKKVLLSGTAKRYTSHNIKLQPQGEHLGCFAGGMVALAAKIFHQTHDLETARELVDGCIWAYESMPAGIMGEISSFLPCQEADFANCTWDEELWKRTVVEKNNKGFVPDQFVDEAQQIIIAKKLPPGFTQIDDARYILRPEAIESVFILYRITGDESLREKAWQMFESISNATRTSIAHAALKDVTQLEPERELLDNMESFWTAETLKYFYLIFSDPSVISLDEYVFNTEAHPLLRPK
ncbi:Endoplasmic reticulum mannosyl-oligosaccharide 1,2-alpha-mannosidase [Fulvia fulva]|uniref:alpha-1,2-Mannosidase n=1 Tax=Passalora fulva TaxID=5499 RepID=A0A9Q8LIJ4_PASFU|nr:Endoplasmic reticulum mannosyl-oligosaccharide 1,2-alpha-mannosidase [Fulvia fulva]KAK4624013.1 Endoplasmic reticulum mannosyl-oligosaccharide 1,2-alpha-mannosidase [Fulvia fulva]KAK4625336.1 Endoplasmic reticulum mannosyl-oligosaccharide 1,2-alpha-mannosidase [Fulvia fulva]UJO18142.1 Endoplasmic reticulum mannosyl-oligosaccharide 1,2-alpha-mannosidase [Fulvia fulva]WPV15297.1 Endoplasmic reticulum mannosyl-oligosaccharide 1,2-alpha-mannosidase [Fulvia fulva]WPV29514.1 Endoplasmic reticulum